MSSDLLSPTVSHQLASVRLTLHMAGGGAVGRRLGNSQESCSLW